MDIAPERTVSGRLLIVVGLTVTALVTAASVVWGPGLRDQVRQEQSPRTLREPIATGSYAGGVWEAVGRFDGRANCVELRLGSDILDRACDQGPAVKSTALPDGGPTVAYGVAPEDATQIDVPLTNGEQVTAEVVAGELGFPVSFWAVEIPAGTKAVSPAAGQ